MTTSAELRALIERLESFDPADGLYDLHHLLMYMRYETPAEMQSPDDRPPNYTGSLDAALALVPEGCWLELDGPRKYLHIPSPSPNYWRAVVTVWENPHRDCPGWGATPALALCIAALRARLAQAEQEEG